MKRPLRLLAPIALALLAASPAVAADQPAYHAYYDARASLPSVAIRAPAKGRAASDLAVSVAATDPVRGVPTFVWAAKGPHAPRARAPLPADAAREHLGRLAPLYALPRAALAAAVVKHVHDPGRGGVIVTLGQEVDGVEVFQETMKLLMRRHTHELVAVSGHLHDAATPRTKAGARLFKLPMEHAVAAALDDLYGLGASPGSLVPVARGAGGYHRFDLAAPVGAAGYRFSRPARVKKVFFPLRDRLVPGYYLEVFAQRAGRTSSDIHAYVIGADDGRVLHRVSLTAADGFKYRVWAETTGNGRPLDGPIEDYTPHPTGTPDGSYPKYIAPSLVSMDGFNTNPDGKGDPWLGPGATETRGNNVDAYTDDDTPDGFSGGSDIRATITAPGEFDRVFDTLADPLVNDDQRMAAVTQLFYTTNWLHDYYYDSGFDEAAGNAQQSNYGRGGVGGDPLHVEAQDGALAGQLDNANMSTPADGESPQMQMYLWSGTESRALDVSPVGSGLATGSADFGAGSFDVTGTVVLAVDGTAPVNDGCEAITNDITGKVALIDRGMCTFQLKVENAQQKGAMAVLIADYTANEPPPFMPGDPGNTVTIPVLSITLDDGNAIKAALANSQTVTAHLTRVLGPKLDGTIDNMVVAHEWGHYLHHRLTQCDLNQCGGESEGWGDFIALMTALRPGDKLDGTFADTIYATGGMDNAAYFGTRRMPYTTDLTKNGFTFKHITDDVPLPTGMPLVDFGGPNSEVHNTGEIWGAMLFEGFVALLGESEKPNPRYTFEEARRRMADYVVAGMMLAPTEPTFTEQRDAILAAALAADEADAQLLAQGFAKRGAGSCAKAPAKDSEDNSGVVESFELAPALSIVSVKLDDSVASCDEDGALDAEETGLLTVELVNGGIAPVPSGEITVTTTAEGVSFPKGDKITLDPLAPFASTTVTFEVTVQRTLAQPEPIQLKVVAKSPTSCEPEVEKVGLFRVNYDNAAASSASDGFESDIDVWKPKGDGASYVWSKAVDEMVNHTWHGIDLDGLSDTRLESPSFQVKADAPLTLSFRHRHSFETGPENEGGPDVYWDGAVIEITTDGGKHWDDVSKYGDPGYEGPIGNAANNPLAKRQGYVSTNASWPAMDQVSIDLGTSLAGQTAQIRFRIGSDEAVGEFGWEIDDVALSGIADTPFPSVIADQAICGHAPVADAGPDQTVGPADQVTLDASGSSDADGDSLTYSWSQTAGPTVSLRGAETAKASFDAPDVKAKTTLTFSVAVSDGVSVASDTVDVVVDPDASSKLEPGGGCACGVEERAPTAPVAPLALAALALLRRRRARRVESR